MNTLLKALYEVLSFITEDAVAHKLGDNPLRDEMNALCIRLGEYLDTLE